MLATVWLLLNMKAKHRWSWLVAVACSGYLSAAGRMINRIWPYVSSGHAQVQQTTSTATVRGVWVDTWGLSDDPDGLLAALHRLAPTVVAVSGNISEELSRIIPVELYPHRMKLQAQSSREMLVISQVPFGRGLNADLGVNAEVGGFIPLEVATTKTVRLGLLDLTQAVTQAQFERNRISSRRLSSLVRNSADTRIVVGQFSATPFSQLVAIYTQQAKVRSLRFDSGLLGSLPLLAFCRTNCPAQVFVSKDVTPGTFEEVKLPGRNRPGLFFDVRVPLDEAGAQRVPEGLNPL